MTTESAALTPCDPLFDPLAGAAVLTRARLGQGPRPFDLPAALQPQNAAQAYAVQDAVVQARGVVAGWKVGASGPDAPPSRGALTQDSVWVCAQGQAQALSCGGNVVIGVEAELVYELGTDLPPRAQPYSRAEVLAAIGSARAAIEVCDTRYAAWGVQSAWSRLADQGSHGALVVGSGLTSPADLAALDPLTLPVGLWVNGTLAVQRPAWGNPAGDPLRLLVWLANEGAHSLEGLRAGQWVTTGSCTGSLLVAPGAVVVAELGGVGRAELHCIA